MQRLARGDKRAFNELYARYSSAFMRYLLRSVADGNIGSIFGWGFAPFHGGALQFIDAMGAPAFVKRSRELAARHGARFEPAAIVVKRVETGGSFGR